VEGFSFDAPKTKQVIELLGKIGIGGRKVLILTNGGNELLYRSARNLQNVKVMPFREASAYHILNANQLLIEAGALRAAEEAVANA
jgi:large subunit ribosomal protein L4